MAVLVSYLIYGLNIFLRIVIKTLLTNLVYIATVLRQISHNNCRSSLPSCATGRLNFISRPTPHLERLASYLVLRYKSNIPG